MKLQAMVAAVCMVGAVVMASDSAKIKVRNELDNDTVLRVFVDSEISYRCEAIWHKTCDIQVASTGAHRIVVKRLPDGKTCQEYSLFQISGSPEYWILSCGT